MKHSIIFVVNALVILLCTFLITGALHADPLALNPTISATGQGMSFASAGAGLETLGSGTETITLNIGGPVISAHLYWAGREHDNVSVSPVPEDQELLFEGVPITGAVIGSEIVPGKSHNIGYRANVTATVTGKYTVPGSYSFSIEDNDTSENLDPLNGATLFVVYTDEADTSIYQLIVFDGLDFAFYDATPIAATITEPVTFSYDSTDTDRTVELLVVVGDAEREREDRVDVSDNPTIVDELNGSSGVAWDNDVFSITIPLGTDSTTVEVVSPQKSFPE